MHNALWSNVSKKLWYQLCSFTGYFLLLNVLFCKWCIVSVSIDVSNVNLCFLARFQELTTIFANWKNGTADNVKKLIYRKIAAWSWHLVAAQSTPSATRRENGDISLRSKFNLVTRAGKISVSMQFSCLHFFNFPLKWRCTKAQLNCLNLYKGLACRSFCTSVPRYTESAKYKGRKYSNISVLFWVWYNSIWTVRSNLVYNTKTYHEEVFRDDLCKIAVDQLVIIRFEPLVLQEYGLPKMLNQTPLSAPFLGSET